ncbi:MAG: hypothetical protein AAFX46_00450, partial [Cyanobacteria bacterium J06636_27]
LTDKLFRPKLVYCIRRRILSQLSIINYQLTINNEQLSSVRDTAQCWTDKVDLFYSLIPNSYSLEFLGCTSLT